MCVGNYPTCACHDTPQHPGDKVRTCKGMMETLHTPEQVRPALLNAHKAICRIFLVGKKTPAGAQLDPTSKIYNPLRCSCKG